MAESRAKISSPPINTNVSWLNFLSISISKFNFRFRIHHFLSSTLFISSTGVTLVFVLQEVVSKARENEQINNRNFVQRLFPELKEELSSISQERWQVEFEKIIQSHIKDTQNLSQVKNNEQQGDVAKLQAQILNYQSIIDDTVGVCTFLGLNLC